MIKNLPAINPEIFRSSELLKAQLDPIKAQLSPIIQSISIRPELIEAVQTAYSSSAQSEKVIESLKRIVANQNAVASSLKPLNVYLESIQLPKVEVLLDNWPIAEDGKASNDSIDRPVVDLESFADTIQANSNYYQDVSNSVNDPHTHQEISQISDLFSWKQFILAIIYGWLVPKMIDLALGKITEVDFHNAINELTKLLQGK